MNMLFNAPFVGEIIVNTFRRRFIVLFYTDVADLQFRHLCPQVFIGLTKTVLEVNQLRLASRQRTELCVAISLLQFLKMFVNVIDGILIISAIRDETFLDTSHGSNACFYKGIFVKVQIG